MGVSASSSALDVAEAVKAIGPAYGVYEQIILDNCLDGAIVFGQLVGNPDDFVEIMQMVGITNKLHLGRFKLELKALESAQAEPAQGGASSSMLTRNETRLGTDCFLSFNWGSGPEFENRKRVVAINSAFKGEGIDAWIDDERIKSGGSPNQIVAEGIENTKCMVVFITKVYYDKVNEADLRDNCNFEFSHAVRKLGPQKMVPVVMENEMRNSMAWKGIVGANLGGLLYVDMCDVVEGTAEFNAKVQEIADRVRAITGPGRVPPPVPASSSTPAAETSEPLAPIRLINFDSFRRGSLSQNTQLSGGFPRCPEDMAQCVTLEDIDRSTSLIVYISHSSLRNYPGAKGWYGAPHPDNAQHDKFALSVEGVEKAWRALAPGMTKCYIWFSFSCINQDADAASDFKQLVKIVQACDCIFTPIVDHDWRRWGADVEFFRNPFEEYQAPLFRDGQYAYVNRAWARVEMLLAANLQLLDDVAQRQDQFSGGLRAAARRNYRPHFLYGTRERDEGLLPLILPPLFGAFAETYGPLRGVVTMEREIPRIEQLIAALTIRVSSRQHELVNSTRDEYIAGMRVEVLRSETSEDLARINLEDHLASLATALGLENASDIVKADDLAYLEDEVGAGPGDSPLSFLMMVRRYMCDLALGEAMELGARPCRRSRLMIVGEGAAGKSSFLRALTSQAFNAEWQSTVGLVVQDYQTEAEEHKPVDQLREAGVAIQEYTCWKEHTGEIGESERTLRQQAASCALKAESVLRHGKGPTSASSSTSVNPMIDSEMEQLPAFARKSKLKANTQIKLAASSGFAASASRATLDAESIASLSGVAESLKIEPSSTEELLSVAPVVEARVDVARSMEDLVFSNSEAGALTFSCWDFGGQRVFQAVQHMFLTRCGVYVIAFDMRKLLVGSVVESGAVTQETVENSLSYILFWIRQIGMLALESPIFLIGTHRDTISDPRLHQEIHDMLCSFFAQNSVDSKITKNIVTLSSKSLERVQLLGTLVPADNLAKTDAGRIFFAVDNSCTADNLDTNLLRLRKLLEHAAESDPLGYVNEEVPVSWLRVCDAIKALERSGVSYIPRADDGSLRCFERIAEDCGAFEGVKSGERGLVMSAMLRIFHQQGIMVYYEEKTLDNIVLLNPQWIIDAIVCVIRDFKLHSLVRDEQFQESPRQKRQMLMLQRRGVLTESMLHIFWREEQSNIPFLLSLMEKLYLVCKLPRVKGEEQQYLVPSLMAIDSSIPTVELEGNFVGAISLKFGDLLPDTFLPRLVVALSSGHSDYMACSLHGDDGELRKAPCLFRRNGVFCAGVPLCGSIAVLYQRADSIEVYICFSSSTSGSGSGSGSGKEPYLAALNAASNMVNDKFYQAANSSRDRVAGGGGQVLQVTSWSDGPESATSQSLFDRVCSHDLFPVESDDGALAPSTPAPPVPVDPARVARVGELSLWLQQYAGFTAVEKSLIIAESLVDLGWDDKDKLLLDAEAGLLTKDISDKWFAWTGDRNSLAATLRKAAADAPKIKISGETGGSKHVMISYCWSQKTIAIELAAALRREGFDVWRDDEGSNILPAMQGQTNHVMAKAVESSNCVIVCVSREYEASKNCMKELRYAFQRESVEEIDKLVFVMMQEDFTPHSKPQRITGTIGLAIGDLLYYKCFKPEDAASVVKSMCDKDLKALGVGRGTAVAGGGAALAPAAAVSGAPVVPPAARTAAASVSAIAAFPAPAPLAAATRRFREEDWPAAWALLGTDSNAKPEYVARFAALKAEKGIDAMGDLDGVDEGMYQELGSMLKDAKSNQLDKLFK